MSRLFVTVLVLWSGVVQAADDATIADMYANIDRLLPGTYTNAVQLTTATGEAQDKAEAFPLTTIIVPMTNPALGETLYYLEEYRDNNPSALTRIRIYSFTTEEPGVRLRLLNPTDVDALQGAHADVARAEALTLDDLHLDRDVCMLDMTHLNGAIVAQMRYQACDVKDTWMDYELIVDETGSWTCYARRRQSDDSLISLQMPAFPCIRQERMASASP